MKAADEKVVNRKKMPVKIISIIMLLFLFCGIVPFLLGYLGLMGFYNNQMENLLTNDLSIAATTLSNHIDNFYEERSADLDIIEGNSMVKLLLHASNKEDMLKLKKERKYLEDMLEARAEANQFVESITVINKDFRVVACSTEGVRDKISVLKEFDLAEYGTKTKFSDLIDASAWGDSDKAIIAIKKMQDKDGEELGYLVEEINLYFFGQVRQSAALFNNGTVYLIDGKAQLITGGDSKTDRQEYVSKKDERTPFHTAWKNRDKEKGFGTITYRMNGHQYLSYYCGFQNINWNLITTVNITEILNRKGKMAGLIVLVLVIAATEFVMLSVVMRYRIGRPIQKIINSLTKIRENQDYSLRIAYEKQDEFGFIAREINTFLVYIENHIRLEKEKAERDALTGLYHKAAIEKIMHKELGRAGAEKKKIAFLFLDIDDFKQFNTDYGHLGGDRTLLFVAKVLSGLGFPAGRAGGDEFIVCITDPPEEEKLKEVLQQLQELLRFGVTLKQGEAPVSITSSIGVALSERGESSFEELLNSADEAMYEIKNAAKNSYCIRKCP